MITLSEFKERLSQEEEVSLIEILGVTSEDIANRFDDIIDYLYENRHLVEEYEEDEDEE